MMIYNFLVALVFSFTILNAQDNSTIEYPNIVDIEPNWIHLITDTTLVNSTNNGSGHIVIFVPFPKNIYGDFLHDVNYTQYFSEQNYISGFIYNKINLVNGESNFVFLNDSRNVDYEEIPITIDSLEWGVRILTARNKELPNPNNPYIVFNGYSNFVVYEIDYNGNLLNRISLDDAPDTYEFIFPGTTFEKAFFVDDTIAIVRQFGVVYNGQPTFGYVMDKVDLTGNHFFQSDTIYMNVNQMTTSGVMTIPGSTHLYKEKIYINHSRLSDSNEDFNSMELIIADKHELNIYKRIDLKQYFDSPSRFGLYPIYNDIVFLTNDQTLSPFDIDLKLIALDTFGNLIEQIPSLNNIEGYDYIQKIHPLRLSNSNNTLIFANNSSRNSIDILETDGSGNIHLKKSLSFKNPSHFMVLTDVIPLEEENSLILKGFLRKDTIINNVETVVGRWNYIISLDMEELGLISSIENVTNEINVNLYPNPTDNLIYVDFNRPTTGIIQLFNSNGQLIFSSDLSETSNIKIPLNGHPSGIYFAMIYSNEGRISLPFVKIE